MLPPREEATTPASRRAVIWETAMGMIDAGYSANRMYEIYRDAGWGINRSDFLGIIRELRGESERSQRIRYVRRDRIPSEDILEVSRHSIPERYRFVGMVDYVDPEGVPRREAFAVDTDILGTRGDIEGWIRDEFSESDTPPKRATVGVEIIRGYISEEAF